MLDELRAAGDERLRGADGRGALGDRDERCCHAVAHDHGRLEWSLARRAKQTKPQLLNATASTSFRLSSGVMPVYDRRAVARFRRTRSGIKRVSLLSSYIVEMPTDAVDRIVQAWAERDPALDVSPLEVVGRLLRAPITLSACGSPRCSPLT